MIYSSRLYRTTHRLGFIYCPYNHNTTTDPTVTVYTACRAAIEYIDAACPDSNEKFLAIMRIEEAMMWVESAIAPKQEDNSND